MLVPTLLFLLAVTHPSGDAVTDPAKGESLLRGCQAEVRLVNLPTLDSAAPMDLIDGAYCIGYLNGFLAAVAPSELCTREEPLGNLVQVYVRFMEHNPRLVDEDKRVGLRRALQESYPCPAPSR